MGNKYISNRGVLITITLFFSAILLLHIIIYFFLKRSYESNQESYVISRVKLEHVDCSEYFKAFELYLPLPNSEIEKNNSATYDEGEGDIRHIKIDYGNSMRMLIDTNRIQDQIFSDSSLLKWLLLREYRQHNYNIFKQNILRSGVSDYSWWNFYGNVKLLLYGFEKEKSLPEGLVSVDILIFEDYIGYLEEYNIGIGDNIFGYNFVVGDSYYNIILSGHSSKKDVLRFLQCLRVK